MDLLTERKLVRVQAGWDVEFDLLENQCLKALPQNGGGCLEVGTLSCDSDMFKMSEITFTSWLAHILSTCGML